MTRRTFLLSVVGTVSLKECGDHPRYRRVTVEPTYRRGERGAQVRPMPVGRGKAAEAVGP